MKAWDIELLIYTTTIATNPACQEFIQTFAFRLLFAKLYAGSFRRDLFLPSGRLLPIHY